METKKVEQPEMCNALSKPRQEAKDVKVPPDDDCLEIAEKGGSPEEEPISVGAVMEEAKDVKVPPDNDCLEIAEKGGSSLEEPPSVGAVMEATMDLPPPLQQEEPTMPGAYYLSFGERARRVVSRWTMTKAASAAGSTAPPDEDSSIDYNDGDHPVARPVAEEDIHEEKAEPVNPQEMAEKAASRRRADLVKVVMTVAILLVVVLVVVLLVLFVFLDIDDETNNDDGPLNATITTIVSPEEQFQASLPQYTLDTIQTDPFSPQAKAYQWLLEDPSWAQYQIPRSLQRFALAAFYYATGGDLTGGDLWKQNQGWLNYSVHECDWAFVPPPNGSELLWLYNEEFMQRALSVPGPCAVEYYENNQKDDSTMMYQHLWFFGNHLQGTLPPEVSLLTSLSNIVLSVNQLHGTLPTQIGQMTQLQELWIFRNELSGSLPIEMTGMSSLTSFLAASNALTGTVPTFLTTMTNLQLIRLATNQLTGTIPTELGLMHENLVDLYLMENLLTGTLPSELGELTKAQFFLFDENPLQGSIPSEYGLLQDLKWLLLQSDRLSGTIPTELGNLGQLENLELYNNKLTGTIPLELTNLTHMIIADLSLNFLSGTFPGEMLENAWTHLEGISLTGNPELVGSVPDSFCNLSHPWVQADVMNCSTDLLCGCDCPCT